MKMKIKCISFVLNHNGVQHEQNSGWIPWYERSSNKQVQSQQADPKFSRAEKLFFSHPFFCFSRWQYFKWDRRCKIPDFQHWLAYYVQMLSWLTEYNNCEARQMSVWEAKAVDYTEVQDCVTTIQDWIQWLRLSVLEQSPSAVTSKYPSQSHTLHSKKLSEQWELSLPFKYPYVWSISQLEKGKKGKKEEKKKSRNFKTEWKVCVRNQKGWKKHLHFKSAPHHHTCTCKLTLPIVPNFH